jgi:hypothetical protein
VLWQLHSAFPMNGSREPTPWSERPTSLPLAKAAQYEYQYSVPARRLPPRAYEVVYSYTQKLERAGLKPEEIEEAERFLVDGAYNKINAREPGEKSEDDLILDIKAAWQFVREVVNRNGARV